MRNFVAFVEHFFTALSRYSRSEQRGVLLLVGIGAAVLAAVVFRPAKSPDAAFLAETDRLADSLRTDYYRRTYAPNDARQPFAENRVRPAAAGAKPAVYIELNSADSARLTAVRGIGPVISRNIVAYRRRLGGFVRKEQLREVRGITDENFNEISAQFFIDTAVIQKIDINFASANSLRSHPYFTGSMVERILRGRRQFQGERPVDGEDPINKVAPNGETKGGWNTLRELVDKDILLPGEAEKVAPYVVFGTH
jgi:DNA uptake protein ComE-like DNA-binding protein